MGEVVAGLVVIAVTIALVWRHTTWSPARRLFVVGLASGIVGVLGVAGLAMCGAAGLERDMDFRPVCAESDVRALEIFALTMLGLCLLLFVAALVAAALDYRPRHVPRPSRRGRNRPQSVASAG